MVMWLPDCETAKQLLFCKKRILQKRAYYYIFVLIQKQKDILRQSSGASRLLVFFGEQVR